MCAALLLAFSLHVGTTTDYNEVHPSVGVDCPSFTTGYYLNSEKGNSFWLGKRVRRGAGFAEAGIVTGYTRSPLLPYIRFGYSFDYVEVFAAPSYDSVQEKPMMVMGLQFTWR